MASGIVRSTSRINLDSTLNPSIRIDQGLNHAMLEYPWISWMILRF